MPFSKLKINLAVLLMTGSAPSIAATVNYNKSAIISAAYTSHTPQGPKVQLTFRDNTNTLRSCTSMQSEVSLDAMTGVLVASIVQDPNGAAGKVTVTCDSLGGGSSFKLTGITYNQ